MEENKTTKKRTTKKTGEADSKSNKNANVDTQEIIKGVLEAMTPMIGAMIQGVLQGQSKEEEEEKNEAIKKVSKEVKKNARVTRQDLNKLAKEQVTLMSIVNGKVVYKDKKTESEYYWDESGAEETLTVGEVLSLHSKSKAFLTTPELVMVEDSKDGKIIEMLKDYLNLRDVEERMVPIEEILDYDIEEIKRILNKSTELYKDLVASKVYTKYKEEGYGNIYMIRELEQILGKSILDAR